MGKRLNTSSLRALMKEGKLSPGKSEASSILLGKLPPMVGEECEHMLILSEGDLLNG